MLLAATQPVMPYWLMLRPCQAGGRAPAQAAPASSSKGNCSTMCRHMLASSHWRASTATASAAAPAIPWSRMLFFSKKA